MFTKDNKAEERNVANDTKQPEPGIDTLKAEARAQQQVITGLDYQINELVKKRIIEKGKLRSITGKIVTIEMRGDA